MAARSSGLPVETRLYVLAITGRPPEDWAALRGSLYAGVSYPLPGSIASTSHGDGRRGTGSRPAAPAPVWQARLDTHLTCAVALLAAVARGEDASRRKAALASASIAATPNSLCAALRAEGARRVRVKPGSGLGNRDDDALKLFRGVEFERREALLDLLADRGVGGELREEPGPQIVRVLGMAGGGLGEADIP